MAGIQVCIVVEISALVTVRSQVDDHMEVGRDQKMMVE